MKSEYQRNRREESLAHQLDRTHDEAHTPRVTLANLRHRASGIVLHPTSLPGPHESGDLGDDALRFASFLAASGQRFWQMLPVGPAGYGNSPYSAQSAFAGSPLLISLDALTRDGLLEAQPTHPSAGPRTRLDYARAWSFRMPRLRAAFASFERRAARDREALDAFAAAHASWLDDYALYRALKHMHGEVSWTDWPDEYRKRSSPALAHARKELASEIRFEKFLQLVFDEQWCAFRLACEERSVALIGDLPIFVAHDSADVWSAPELFQLDPEGRPTFVAGVPPDYFSATGQRWGNPLYRWSVLRQSGYAWWIARMRATLARFDLVRLDHFIGFVRYWAIPARSPVATEGRWIKGPGAHFLTALHEALGGLPLIAEDLGAVTPRVIALRDRFRLPGIRVLQFAFGDDPSAPTFLPHNYPRRAVVYTGTHDNDTVAGWYRNDAAGSDDTRTPIQVERERVATLRYLGTSGEDIHWDMIRAAMVSVARLAMFPLQDVLGLGSEARMNRPGRAADNWEWRFEEGALTRELATKLGDLTTTYGRHARSAETRR